MKVLLGAFISFILFASQSFASDTARRVIDLNGVWNIAEGAMDKIPDEFGHQVVVPGLVDLATPPFDGVGFKSGRREAFWYRREFRIMGELSAFAVLKVHKAKYGTRVFINGHLAGDHLPCFTPGYFDVRKFLHEKGKLNEIIIRVGADRDAVPKSIPTGGDFEKYKYIPGIYDRVELILSGTPRIINIQTVPDIESGTVQIVTQVAGSKNMTARLAYTIRQVSTQEVVASAKSQPVEISENQTQAIIDKIEIPQCHLWSPEDPFLYELKVSSGADEEVVRFGMRSFRFDKKSGRAVLNGKPYFMRGTNVCVFRFFEDQERGFRPWDKTWVRRLHEKFKYMHWNSIRYCIGFPPEIWYEIADEVGFLIQDEFPIWHLGRRPQDGGWPPALKSDELVNEYTEWMRERWNHPCVVIWDAQNETRSQETGAAICAVRHLDLSHRPWDNGWEASQDDADCREAHPYLFIKNWHGKAAFKLADLNRMSGRPRLQAQQKDDSVPIIVNEYGWLWLNRDGTPTTLTREVYANLIGRGASIAQRRYTYARYLAALTEFWRCHRECAGVLHFCSLSYSRPGGLTRPEAGATSDHFTDLEALNLEPNFARYVRDAFSPVGLMIDKWDEQFAAGVNIHIPVFVINDLETGWHGKLYMSIVNDNGEAKKYVMSGDVKGLGREIIEFNVQLPREPGHYQFVAELQNAEGESVQSIRDFNILPGLKSIK